MNEYIIICIKNDELNKFFDKNSNNYVENCENKVIS